MALPADRRKQLAAGLRFANALRTGRKPKLSFDEQMNRLATETRVEIFRYVLVDSIQGKTPALVQALRGNALYYHEALRALYNDHIMRLGPRRGPASYSLYGLTPDILSLLRILKIEHKSKIYKSKYGLDLGINFYPDLALESPQILAATNLRELHLDFSKLSGFEMNYVQIISLWLGKLSRLRIISLEVQKYGIHDTRRFDRGVRSAIKEINEGLDVDAELEEGTPFIRFPNWVRVMRATWSLEGEGEGGRKFLEWKERVEEVAEGEVGMSGV